MKGLRSVPAEPNFYKSLIKILACASRKDLREIEAKKKYNKNGLKPGVD